MVSKFHQEIYSLTPDGLPQAVIDRAASYAADGERSVEQAIEAAIAAEYDDLCDGCYASPCVCLPDDCNCDPA